MGSISGSDFPMALKPFQVSIRDLMIAMFWVGIAITAWSGALRVGRPPHPGILPDRFQFHETLILATLGWSSMFSAIWALVGRAKKGVLIGLGMWVFILILCLLFLV